MGDLRTRASPTSRYSSVALALNVLGLAAATGTEWVINLVFVGLDPAQIAALRTGPLGTAFVAASMIFLLGSILYCSALLRDGKAPRIPVIAYAIATVPIALRTFVPELGLDVALGLLGASVIWLALWMLGSHPARMPVLESLPKRPEPVEGVLTGPLHA